jgi:hypothetical protein
MVNMLCFLRFFIILIWVSFLWYPTESFVTLKEQPHILGRRKRKRRNLQRRRIQIPGDRSLAPTCSVSRTSQPFEKCRWTGPTAAASCFNQSQVGDRDTTFFLKKTQSRVKCQPSIIRWVAVPPLRLSMSTRPNLTNKLGGAVVVVVAIHPSAGSQR